jgi:hypothetical protein
MNKQKSNRTFILLAIGLLVMSSTFILQRLTGLTDFAEGAIKGVGLGLILLALILPKIQSRACRN